MQQHAHVCFLFFLNKIDMSNSYYQSFSISKDFVLYFEVILLRFSNFNIFFRRLRCSMRFMVVCGYPYDLQNIANRC